jgi:hypothetical protein
MHTKVWSEYANGRDYSEDLSIDERIILKWILGKYGGKLWTGCVWFRIGTSGGHCEHGKNLRVT